VDEYLGASRVRTSHCASLPRSRLPLQRPHSAIDRARDAQAEANPAILTRTTRLAPRGTGKPPISTVPPGPGPSLGAFPRARRAYNESETVLELESLPQGCRARRPCTATGRQHDAAADAHDGYVAAWRRQRAGLQMIEEPRRTRRIPRPTLASRWCCCTTARAGSAMGCDS